MKRINKNAEKVEILSKIIFNNIVNNQKNDIDDFLSEAYEIVELIDGIDNVVLVSELILGYYLKTAINDVWSDYESLSKVIAKEYLAKITKL